MGLLFPTIDEVVASVKDTYLVSQTGSKYRFDRTGPFGSSTIHYDAAKREVRWDLITPESLTSSKIPIQETDANAVRWVQRVLYVLAYNHTDQRPREQRPKEQRLPELVHAAA